MTQPPREPTNRREPTFSYPTYSQYGEQPTYLTPPPPPPYYPPPPVPSRKALIVALVLLNLLLVLVASAGAYQLGKQSTSPQAAAGRATPTLDGPQAITSTDFSKFIEAFAQQMAAKNYTVIQSATDTENFFAIPLRASGRDDWNGMYSQLTTGNLTFTVTYPPITADQESYTCEGYSKTGITLLSLSIDALDIMYVVGTASEPNPSAQTAPNGTVFIFEVPRFPDASWLWRGVTFNNQLGCG